MRSFNSLDLFWGIQVSLLIANSTDFVHFKVKAGKSG